MVEINQRVVDDVILLQLEGEIDAATSPKLREVVLAAFRAPSARLLVSLEQVSHIDSSGLATLVEGLQRAEQSKGRMVLTELDEHLWDVFRMTHLDEVFEIAPTLAQAAERLGIQLPA